MLHNVSGDSGAYVFGAVSASTFWLALVGTVWKAFLEPDAKRARDSHSDAMKQLRDDYARDMAQMRDDREADNRRCDRQILELQGRINHLEAAWDIQKPAHLRQQVQGALSEHAVRLHNIEEKK